MRNKILRLLLFALFSLALAVAVSSSAFGAATIVIQNNDAAGVGFNDPTVVAPVGGNTGTTLGQQRLNAFQSAANTWGATLTSSVTITVRAQWTALTCTSGSAVLGSAGSLTIFRDFTGAPFAGTWYGGALTNKLFGSDADPAAAEINANFNVNLGQPGCLTGTFFYLGLDNNHGSNIDLVTVLEHEFAHGLGFQTFTNGTSGAPIGGFFSAYDRFLMDDTSGKSWLQMTNAERSASALNTNNLAWDGPKVSTDAATVLTQGKDAFGKALVFTPNPIQSGSSVSHWTTLAFPNQLMEPAINGDLTHNVTAPSDLTFAQLSDVGWVTTALPNAISATSGNNQSTPINQPFAVPFAVTVSPVVTGLTITWTVNPSAGGAGGTFATTGTRFATSTTNALGVAAAPQFTANSVAGSYSMNATVAGAGTAAFTMTNFNTLTPTTTVVTSNANPSVFGQSVTFTATVSPIPSGGTVDFVIDGGTVASGVALNGSGQATFATSSLNIAGSPHTVTGNYSGNISFGSSSGSLTGGQTVNKANTSTGLTSSQNPSVFGQSVTFTATVNATAPGAGTRTGTVQFLDGGNPITGCTSVTLSGGQAQCGTTSLSVGNHTVTAQYSGDGNFNTSSGSMTGNPQVVNKANTTTGLASSQNPSVFGQSVTFTATVNAIAPGAGTRTGTVQFLDGGNPITGCTSVTLSGGQAQCAITSLSVGNHTITAAYSGDSNFNTSNGSLTGNPQVVNKANTTTGLTSSQNPSVFGQSVTFTATVNATAPGAGTRTGTVQFLDGGNPITGCTSITVSGGQALCLISTFAVGNHTVTAQYSGDGNFNTSNGSLTGNPQTVNKANTTTTITNAIALGTATNVGQSYPVTWNVVVTLPGAGTLTGNVTVSDGTDTCFAAVSAGTCNLTSTTPGAKTITATYGGDANFNSGVSTGVAHAVAVPTFAVGDVTANEGNAGQTVFTFTITKTGSTTLGSTVSFNTSDGTATAPGDYAAIAGGSVVFAAADATRTVTVNVNGDTTFEPNETLTLHLSSVTNGSITDADGLGTILNDDAAPPASIFEGDINRVPVIVGGVATFPNPGPGDGVVNTLDLEQFDRFQSGANIPSTGSGGEFERHDTAPVGTLGDGCRTAADKQQIRNYANTSGQPGTLTPSGGPASPPCVPAFAETDELFAGLKVDEKVFPVGEIPAERVVRVVPTTVMRGNKVVVYVELDSLGNETGVTFSLSFDPTKLSISDFTGTNGNPDVVAGTGAPTALNVSTNGSEVADGRIGILLDTTTPFTAGTRQVITLTFHLAENAAADASAVTLIDGPLNRFTSGSGVELPTTYNSVDVSLSGRATTANGRRISNAKVVLTGNSLTGHTYVRSRFARKQR